MIKAMLLFFVLSMIGAVVYMPVKEYLKQKRKEKKYRSTFYLIFIMCVFSSCATSKDYVEFTSSTCPPYCEGSIYDNCDEIIYNEQGEKVCVTLGRWE